MNVVGCEPDGWWRDRAGAMRRLIGELEAFAGALGEEVTVVFDGQPRPGFLGARTPRRAGASGQGAGGPVEVVWAPGGPDAADDEIVLQVGRDPRPHDLVVVTSDAGLAARVEPAGPGVVGARAWRRRLLPAALSSQGGEGGLGEQR